MVSVLLAPWESMDRDEKEEDKVDDVEIEKRNRSEEGVIAPDEDGNAREDVEGERGDTVLVSSGG